MIEIGINTDDFRETYGFDENQIDTFIDSVVKSIGLAYYDKWRKIASQELGSVRKEYINSIILTDSGFMTATVSLVGQLPNMIEQGASPFDMKEGFSRSTKKKLKKNGGWFLTIPFRYATPDALGEDSAFSGILTQELYNQVRREKTIKAANLPVKEKAIGVRQTIMDNKGAILFKKYEHKAPIMAGLTQYKKFYESAAQSQYMTFRRVSDESDPDSWIHRGFDSYNLAQKALDDLDIETIVQNAKENFINNLDL